MFSVFIVTLLSTIKILDIEAESLDKTFSMEINRDKYQDISRFEEVFSQINSKTEFVNSVQEKHFNWFHILDNLENVIADDIFLTELATKNYKIFLTGNAKSRESLVSFKDRVEESPCFYESSVPLSDIVKKDDIDFQMEFGIEEECLSGDEANM